MKLGGHQEVAGETMAKLKVWHNRRSPFDRFLDNDRINTTLRRCLGLVSEDREIQVKYGRVYDDLPRWQQACLACFSCRPPHAEEVCEPRPELCLETAIDAAKGCDRKIDIFLPRRVEFQGLIPGAVQFTSKGVTKTVCFACGLDGNQLEGPRLSQSFGAQDKVPVSNIAPNRRCCAPYRTAQ